MRAARIASSRYGAELDPADPDQQTVLFWYPVVTAGANPYVRSAVKIEAGAKSAFDPHVVTTVRPYAAHDVADLDLAVTGITTVEPQRTFWDKVVIPAWAARVARPPRATAARGPEAMMITGVVPP